MRINPEEQKVIDQFLDGTDLSSLDNSGLQTILKDLYELRKRENLEEHQSSMNSLIRKIKIQTEEW